MWDLVAAVGSAACMLASGHALALAVAPTALDERVLLGSMRNRARVRQLERRLAVEPAAAWERDLLEAACADDPGIRGALIEEQVVEADWRTQRWTAVPRVCARVATSVGFLGATLILIGALGPDDASALSSGGLSGSPLGDALNTLAIGLVGTSFCVAVHMRVRAIAAQRRSGIDNLVDRLRSVVIS